MNKYFIDLFSGCGGLSLGLKAAGFKHGFALEKSPMAAETYFHNLIHSIKAGHTWDNYLSRSSKSNESDKIIFQLEKGIVVSPLQNLLKRRGSKIRKYLEEYYNNVALVVGGPPCQGFSIAGKRTLGDERNDLPWQFLDFLEIVNPKAVLMENVVGMRNKFSAMAHDDEAAFHAIRQKLSHTGKGYEVQELQLNSVHYGVPQSRERVFLLAIRKDIANKKRIKSTQSLWVSGNNLGKRKRIPAMCPKPTVKNDLDYFTVKDAIGDLWINGASRPTPYLKVLNGETGISDAIVNKMTSESFQNNHEKRKHTERVAQRFKLYQLLGRHSMNGNLLNDIGRGYYKSNKELSSKLEKIICSKNYKAPDGTLVAMNDKDFILQVRELSTLKHSQYLFHADKPARTVLSIPDDGVHPCEPRTFTVREMARFQSFPDNFEFRGKVTTGGDSRKIEVPQYTQVGNAVPPLLALALGNKIMELLY